ncbi:MAG: GIY-YIG nuclease family protein [Patescibacteria group bacterium]|nr:GIY-YIG nuclease family protein [Patescibacteria group bacterium]
MDYYVYILYSLKDKRLYVGCTSNLQKRFKLHNSGMVDATKYRRPLELIHYENFKNKADAFNRERFFKSLWGSRLKKKIMQKYLKDMAKTICETNCSPEHFTSD